MHNRKSRNKIRCSILDVFNRTKSVSLRWQQKTITALFERDCSSNAKAIHHGLTTE